MSASIPHLSPQGKLSALYAYLKERQIRDLPDREQQIHSVGLTWRPFTVPGRVSLDDPPSPLGQEVFSMADHEEALQRVDNDHWAGRLLLSRAICRLAPAADSPHLDYYSYFLLTTTRI